MAEYEVSWSVAMEATTPEDAAGQAWAAMEDATRGGPASVVVVRTLEGEHVVTLDMGFDPPEVIRRG